MQSKLEVAGRSRLRSGELLPQLPLAEWRDTKDTLHLWLQILGKIKLATTPPRIHWWHVPLYLDVRGLTTRVMRTPSGVGFQLDVDFIAHRLVLKTQEGHVASFKLGDGLTVAEFLHKVHLLLGAVGIEVDILEKLYGVPMTTPFPRDLEHASASDGPPPAGSAAGRCATANSAAPSLTGHQRRFRAPGRA